MRKKYKYIMIMTSIVLDSLIILFPFITLWWLLQKLVFHGDVSPNFPLIVIEILMLFLIAVRIYLGGKKLYSSEGENSIE